jgi:hypothetical protein
MTITTPRSMAGHVLRLQWQTSEGSTASTSGAIVLIADSCSIDRGSVRQHPGGTTGFATPIDTEFESGIRPTAKLVLHVGALQLAPFLESITGGQPTVSNANITEANDDGNLVGTWALTGLRPGINTSSGWVLYVTVDADYGDGTTTRVALYSDSARTALVAAGTIVDGSVPGTVTLTAQNNSGLSGSVALASVPVADDEDITLTVGSMSFVWADQWARFFTLWRDTGAELEILTDCAVTNLKVLGEGGGGVLRADVEIAAKNHGWSATTFSPAAPPSVAFLPYLGTFYADQDDSQETVSPYAVEFEIARELANDMAGGAVPAKLVSKGRSITGQHTFPHCAESQVILARALADGWDALECKFQSGTQYIDFVFDKVKFLKAMLPDTSPGELGDLALPWVAVQDTSAPNTAPLAITAAP